MNLEALSGNQSVIFEPLSLSVSEAVRVAVERSWIRAGDDIILQDRGRGFVSSSEPVKNRHKRFADGDPDG